MSAPRPRRQRVWILSALALVLVVDIVAVALRGGSGGIVVGAVVLGAALTLPVCFVLARTKPWARTLGFGCAWALMLQAPFVFPALG